MNEGAIVEANQIGIDKDSIYKGRKLLKILLDLTKISNRIKKIERRLSSGKNGYHFRITLEKNPLGKNWTKRELLAIRSIFGDCLGRQIADWQRLKLGNPIDRLFYYKDKRYAGKWKTIYEKKNKKEGKKNV